MRKLIYLGISYLGISALIMCCRATRIHLPALSFCAIRLKTATDPMKSTAL